MIEIRITPNSPEMMAKVISLLTDLNGQVTMAAPKAAAFEVPLPKIDEEITIEPVADVAPEPAAELPEVTLEEVRKKLAALSQGGKSAAVKEILAGFGASKLTDVSPEKYSELMAAAEEL